MAFVSSRHFACFVSLLLACFASVFLFAFLNFLLLACLSSLPLLDFCPSLVLFDFFPCLVLLSSSVFLPRLLSLPGTGTTSSMSTLTGTVANCCRVPKTPNLHTTSKLFQTISPSTSSTISRNKKRVYFIDISA